MIVSNEGAELAAYVDGDPEAPALVLGHGVGSSARFLREAFADPVTMAGWRLVTYDLRGHGGSTDARDPGDLGLAAYASDAAAVAAAVDARVLGGVSLGGHAAVAAVASRRVEVAAVLACLPAWSGDAVEGEGPHAVVASEVRAVGIDGVLARLEQATDLPVWLRDLLLRDYRGHDSASLAAALLALDGATAPSRSDIERLGVPIALVAWSDDPGHPDAVAHDWADAAGRAAVVQTTIDAVGRDRRAMGRAAVAALRRVGVDAGSVVAGRDD